MDEKKGVWRTIRGRRVFIEEGQSLYDAMEKSGKFGKLQGSNRPQVHAKTQSKENKKRFGDIIDEVIRQNKIAEDEITEARRLGNDIREEIAKDTRDYAFGKLKQQKENVLESQRNINKYMRNNNQRKEYEMKMDEYDVDNWREQVKANNEQMEKRLQELQSQRGKGEYQYHEDKWLDDYYGTFRENERKNAKIKKENPDEKYEYVDAYAGYKEKFDKHKDYDTWYGSEYTNDEFMEHLTDANWHAERKLIEEAGLTNAQLTKLKNQVKLGQWSADLDMERTRRLIDEVKGSNKSKGDKIREIKAQNSYTSKELKEKYGTDDVDIINAGKPSDERVSKKDDEIKKSREISNN